MTWKNILVHIDAAERSALRLALAVKLARQNQARLSVVFGQLAEPEQVGTVVTWPSRAYVEAAAAGKARFEAATQGLADARWLDLNRGGIAELSAQLVAQARFADLVVMGQYDARQAAIASPQLVEEVVLHSGRPVLILPYIGEFADIGRHPLIAWTDSAGSARALHDALPLYAGCDAARVVSIAVRPDEALAASGELAATLAAQGVSVRCEEFASGENEQLAITDMLLNRVSDHGIDLLVVGGDAPTGLFGKRDSDMKQILAHMTVPVLMSN